MPAEPPASGVGWDLDEQVTGWPGLAELTDRLRADVCVIGLGGSGLAAMEELVSLGVSAVGGVLRTGL